MAYGLKYQFSFNDNASKIAGVTIPITVSIYQDGFTGDYTTLVPADSPCVINEVNNTETIFAAIRAKEMKIRFVTDNTTAPAIEDLLSNKDNEFKIIIEVDSAVYLIGFLLNDQMSESWFTDGTKHYIDISATDNLGALKNLPITGFIPTDKVALYDIVRAALDAAVPDLPINIFDNLFEESFDDRTVTDTNDSYQQCKVDMRTFVNNFTEFENSYTILTKILESRNSTLFQHNGEWQIIRIPELFTSDTIDGTRYLADTTMEAVIWENTASIHATGDHIPVENFMMKSYTNALKFNKVFFNYDNFDEIFCNQLWQRGANTLDTPTVKEYEVDCWDHFQGAVVSTTPASVDFGRRQEIDSATEQVKDEYLFLELESGSGGESFVRSSSVLVSENDKLNISFQRKVKNNYTGAGNEILARVLLYANDSTYYTLDDDGKWYLSNSTFTVNNKTLIHSYGASDDRNKWVEKIVDTEFIPKDGKIYIHLQEGSADLSSGQETHFKDLRINYRVYLTGKNFVNVTGDYNKLTIDNDYKDSKDYQVYLSDSPKYLVKGALFRADGDTLTTMWYESAAPATLYPIKKWNVIAHYLVTYRNFQTAEGDFYKWITAFGPVAAVSVVTFINGATNKRFLPVAIRNLDLSKSKFSCLFAEITDYPTNDSAITKTHEFKYIYKNNR